MIKKSYFFLFLLLVNHSVFAQELKTSVSKKNINVGEPFRVEFELLPNGDETIKFSPEKDSVLVFMLNDSTKQRDTAYFEVLSYSSPQKEKIQGKYYWKFGYELMGFEPGYFFFPPKQFVTNGKRQMSNPVLIPIALMEKDINVDLYDIEENFSELPSPFIENLKRVVLWSLLVVVLIVMAAIYYFLFYKKRAKSTNEGLIHAPNNKKEALHALNELMKKELWEKDQLKEHFTEISLITRKYLSKETRHSFMERTSLETQLILKKKGMNQSQLEPLGLILNVSDMVKFAQSSLGKEGIISVYQVTKKFIEEFEIR